MYAFPYHFCQAELLRMAVSSQFRGRGIAGLLMDEALEFCQKNEFSSIILDTSDVKVEISILLNQCNPARVHCERLATKLQKNEE